METLPNEKPLISIIVPVYNVSKYLEKCLNSIVSQTYSNLEIILVDDGSTDLSGEICDRFGEKDKRIKVFHIKNRGIAMARNLGLSKSHGEYISFVDSDDRINECFIEKLYLNAVKNNSDMVHCRIIREGTDLSGNVCFSESMRYIASSFNTEIKETYDVAEYMRYFLKTNESHLIWSKLYKRNIAEAVVEPEGVIHEDLASFAEYVKKCSVISVEPEALYYYNENNAFSVSHSFSEKETDDLKWAIKKCAKDCVSIFPEMKDEVFLWYRNRILLFWKKMAVQGEWWYPFSLSPTLIPKENRYLFLNMKSAQMYVFRHLPDYMKMNSRKKIQALIICFFPVMLMAYEKYQERYPYSFLVTGMRHRQKIK